MPTQRPSRAGDPVASDSGSTRASARRRLLAGGVAATALGAQWVTPVVRSALLPAHAQASGGRVWTYSIDAMTDDQTLEVRTVGTGTNPCGIITGRVRRRVDGTTPFVLMACPQGPWEIVSWIINGEEAIVGPPVSFNGGTGADNAERCGNLVFNFAQALDSIDPGGGWHPRNIGDLWAGDCGYHVRSGPQFEGTRYGQMVIENLSDNDFPTYILQPVAHNA
jgi:hypothetical protein